MKSIESFDFQRKLIQNNLLSKKPDKENEDLLIENVTSLLATPAVEQWREFFLTDFSCGFLNRIAYDFYGKTWQYILGEYYTFISPVGGEASIPYYKVSLYSRHRDAILKTYLSVITTRYFYNERQKEIKKNHAQNSFEEETVLKVTFSGNEVIENPWYSLLIYDGDNESLSEEDRMAKLELEDVIAKLPEKEQLVVHMVYYEDCSGEEIFEELLEEHLINPRRDVSTLTTKDKQDAVANIKKRALKHINKMMKS